MADVPALLVHEWRQAAVRDAFLHGHRSCRAELRVADDCPEEVDGRAAVCDDECAAHVVSRDDRIERFDEDAPRVAFDESPEGGDQNRSRVA